MNRRVGLSVALTALVSLPALGWNPLVVRAAGANRWNTSAGPIVWNPDGGPLGQLSNAAAIAMISDEIAKWSAVPTTTIAYTQGGQIVNTAGTPVDVTLANYLEIVGAPLHGNGQNPIIFDNNRQIFNALGQPSSVLGFAGFLNATGGTIVKGYAIFQGDCFDGDGGDTCGETAEIGFRGMMVHEFGHFNGLGHSSVNRELTGVGLPGCAPATTAQIETMSPTVTTGASTLHHDDIAGISSLYPSATFFSSTAAIRGTLFDRNGTTPFAGGNMVLRPDTSDCSQRYDRAQAIQSGSNPADSGGPGTYLFAGLAANTDFVLAVEAIGGGGSFPIGGSNPPALGAPEEFYNGFDEGHFDPPDDPAAFTTIGSGPAGGSIAGIDVRLNNAGGPGEIPGDGPGTLTVAKFEGALPPQTLQLDDGSVNNFFGFPGTARMAWINRFSPAPAQLPFELQRIDVYFLDPSAAVGRAIRLLAYLDPSGSGNPANATLVHSQDTTILALNQFNQYTLSAPVSVTSGDLYVGVFDLVADVATTFIAAYDAQTASGRSYRQLNGTAPGNYTLEAGAADKAWGIRAFGATTPPPGSVTLAWGLSCNESTVPGQDYAVYEGSIASLTGVLDHAPLACGNDEATSLTILGAGPNRFWLISPLLATREGSPGTGSNGSDRTPAVSCATLDPEVCP